MKHKAYALYEAKRTFFILRVAKQRFIAPQGALHCNQKKAADKVDCNFLACCTEKDIGIKTFALNDRSRVSTANYSTVIVESALFP